MTMLDQMAQHRADMHTRSREILDTAEAHRRDLTAAEARELEALAGDLEALNARTAEMAGATEARRRAEAIEARHGLIPPAGTEATPGLVATPEHTEEVRCWLPSVDEYETRAIGSSSNPFLPVAYYQNWFDKLRAASVVLSAGPRIIPTDSTSLSVPKITASVTVSATSENAQISPSDPTFAAITLTPRKLAALCYASNEAMADSDPSLRTVVADDLVRQLATVLDAQFLEGDGSAPDMRGIRNMSGVTAGPSLGANGATPTLATFADMVESLETANGNLDRAVWFMHPRTWAVLRTIVDGDSRYQLQPDPTVGARRSLFGRPVFVTTNIGIAETVGTSTDCSWTALADLDQIVVAQRQQVELVYDSSFRFDYDQTAVRVTARFDIAPIHAAGIVLTTGVRG